MGNKRRRLIETTRLKNGSHWLLPATLQCNLRRAPKSRLRKSIADIAVDQKRKDGCEESIKQVFKINHQGKSHLINPIQSKGNVLDSRLCLAHHLRAQEIEDTYVSTTHVGPCQVLM